MLSGGRLHLHHGPIDLIVEVFGPGRKAAYKRAVERFEFLLETLVGDASALRRPRVGVDEVVDPVAKRMVLATAPFAPTFITPMAAVAGAVADEMLGVIRKDPRIVKAYVNNGGDVALHLSKGECLNAAVAGVKAARITLKPEMNIGGIATSGWGGRSHSLGIADSVTVLARTAAAADAAATLIANAVDLPDHRDIRRRAAVELSPDSDLGERRVTVAVPLLSKEERDTALQRGVTCARSYVERSLIGAAFIVLQGECREISKPDLNDTTLPVFKETIDA